MANETVNITMNETAEMLGDATLPDPTEMRHNLLDAIWDFLTQIIQGALGLFGINVSSEVVGWAILILTVVFIITNMGKFARLSEDLLKLVIGGVVILVLLVVFGVI